MFKKLLGLLIASIFLVSLCGCFSLGPNPKVISAKQEPGFEGFNAITKVILTIKNEGGPGEVKIRVTADGDKGTYYDDEKVIYFDEKQTKTVVFVIDSKYGEKLSVHYTLN